ncbi:hypothetical protein FVEN_g8202 [Fusarium venenatum]|uniref:Enoyl reductase (ER) domain-containing protein n=2 Tax=Fusarium venenatum TaxID=56646 RepID=A0A2L2SYN6_9HYPO|nr:uncharacterized protein FVRRES_04429 [Fusarium venenatum]KAG8353934.1 hypothetical protein FVEN_g8202 [Fusarium venenatum]CEI59993.1 unnamed protein product [Fusarium venenatum]
MAYLQHFQPQPMAELPSKQSILLLHEVGQRYQIESNGKIPTPSHGDLLIEIHAIGLNPIDWKSATYGFGIPQLPCVNGREFVGRVVISENGHQGGWHLGDWVLGISTDYRDFKKAAFQEFAIVCAHNAIRIPPNIGNPLATAAVGVAYVTAALSLGVCLGVGFSRQSSIDHHSLLQIAQEDPSDLPLDVEPEVIPGIAHDCSPRPDDWIMIYGASSVTAQIAIQLSKLAGLKVVGVANLEKHRQLLESLGTDILIDREDLAAASQEVNQLLPGRLRFAIDTVGSSSAEWCQNVIIHNRSQTAGTTTTDLDHSTGYSRDEESRRGHLVVFTGKPKTSHPEVKIHRVPVKLFHTHERIGTYLSTWLHELLDGSFIQLPRSEIIDGGLGSINGALERLKNGDVSGSRLIIRTK